MVDLSVIPQDFVLILPLSIAAGVDLYLTLLLLGVAASTGLYGELPGATADLGSPWVLLMTGGFYVLELAAERWPPGAVVWNGFHAVIRPGAGALLALLVLDGQAVGVMTAGAVLAGLLASLAHATRTGWGVLRWLDPTPRPRGLLLAALEDVAVLGSVALVLDAPRWALLASVLVLLGSLPSGGSRVRAFLFAVRLVLSRARAGLTGSGWCTPAAFPSWVRKALELDGVRLGAAVRGSPAGVHRLPGLASFVTGWAVMGLDEPRFYCRTARGVRRVDLARWQGSRVTERPFFLRVDSAGPGRARLFLEAGGPPPGGLGDGMRAGTKSPDPG